MENNQFVSPHLLNYGIIILCRKCDYLVFLGADLKVCLAKSQFSIHFCFPGTWHRPMAPSGHSHPMCTDYTDCSNETAFSLYNNLVT